MGDYGRIETHLKLIDLMLVNNRISGQIPSGWRHDFLGSADLQRNAFGGHLPRGSRPVADLAAAARRQCHLGTLPDDWGEGLNVKYVMLARNASRARCPTRSARCSGTSSTSRRTG